MIWFWKEFWVAAEKGFYCFVKQWFIALFISFFVGQGFVNNVN